MMDADWARTYFNPQCSNCSLCKTATTVCIPGRGNPNADIMFVGEAPGYNEDIEGRPFIGKAGNLLSSILHKAGIDEQDVWITNIVKCRPPDNRDPTDLEIIECVDYLRTEIQNVRPKVIVALGKPASRVLLGDTSNTSMGKMRGIPRKQDFASYFKIDGDLTITVVPTWHPAFALRKASATVEIETDLSIALRLTTEAEEATDYKLINDLQELVEWTEAMLALHRAGRVEYMACDIEVTDVVTGEEFTPRPYAPDTNIASIQFCWSPGKAVLIPILWKESCFNHSTNMQTLRKCLGRIFDEVPVVGQNFKFDATYLWCKLGLLPKKFVFDTMLAHHFLYGGLLANGLDFLAARYLGKLAHKAMLDEHLAKLTGEDKHYGNLPIDVLVEYGCADTDKTFQLVPVLRQKLEQEDYTSYPTEVFYPNMLAAFEALIMFPWRSILNWELRGAATDQERFPQVAAQLKADMEATLATIHESKFHRPWQEATKEKNKKRVKALKKCKYRLLCGRCGHELYVDPPKPKYPDYGCPTCHASADEIQINRKMVPTGEVVTDPEQPEWIYKTLNPRSWKQVAYLLYEVMALPTQTEKGKITTNKAARAALIDYCMEEDLQDHAEVIEALGTFSAVHKLYSNYGEGLQQFFFVKDGERSQASTAQFEPDTGVGFLHTHYFQDGTVSGRLSTREPPLHTIPKKSVIKELFPSRYPGGLILQADYSQAEVRAFVIETGDADLRQAFQDGVDPHTLTASKAFAVPMDHVTSAQRQDSKSITFGILFGRGDAAIAKQTGRTVEEMRRMKRDFLDSMPRVKKWIRGQHKFVDSFGCVLSRLGRRRFLQDDLDSGDDLRINHAHNVSVNHPIQSLIGDVCTNSAARLDYRLVQEGFRSVVFLTVHDSVLLDVVPEEILTVPSLVREEMFSRLPLTFPFINVPMDIDVEVGVTWGTLMKMRVPEEGLLVLDGPISHLSGIHDHLAHSWEIVVENLSRREDEDGRPTVEAALRLRALKARTA